MYSILTIPAAHGDDGAGRRRIIRESDVDKFKACSAATTLTAYLTGCEQEHVFQMPWHKLDQSQLPTMLDSYHSMHGDERVYSGDRLHTFYDVPADDAFFLEAIFLEETNFKYVESLVHEYKSTPKIAQRVHGSLSCVLDPDIYGGFDIEDVYHDYEFRVMSLPLRNVFELTDGASAFDVLPTAMFDLEGGFLVVQTIPGALTIENRRYALESVRARRKFTRITDVFEDTKHLSLL